MVPEVPHDLRSWEEADINAEPPDVLPKWFGKLPDEPGLYIVDIADGSVRLLE